MDLDDFRRFILTTPSMLDHLLTMANVHSSAELLAHLEYCYRCFTDEDVDEFRETETISIDRLRDLAMKAGLDLALSSLPLTLYHLYLVDLANRPGHAKFTEDEITFFFDGPLLSEYHSLVEGTTVRWNPSSQQLSFVLEHDEEIAEACDQYLVSKGRSFRSIDELVEHAKTHQWPGWEKIKKQYEEPDDDFDFLEL